MRRFQAELLKGLEEGVFALPVEARDMVLRSQAKRCAEMTVELAQQATAPVDPRKLNDIDEFLSGWMNAFPGQRELKREGNVIHWTFKASAVGGCICPLVRNKIIESNPKLCLCTCHFVRQLVEWVTKRPVTVDLLASPQTTGSKDCHFLVHLEPPLATANSNQ